MKANILQYTTYKVPLQHQQLSVTRLGLALSREATALSDGLCLSPSSVFNPTILLLLILKGSSEGNCLGPCGSHGSP